MRPSRSICQTTLARSLGIHRNTVRNYMKIYGIKKSFSSITNQELDQLVKQYKSLKPASGYRYVIGFLRSNGLRVQRDRVIQSLHRVDRLGRLLRRRITIHRRKYKSSRPNALWHCDGHHKLILWGIVIHGFIDGNCRTVSLILFITKFLNYVFY
jgi:hypothetical protein